MNPASLYHIASTPRYRLSPIALHAPEGWELVAKLGVTRTSDADAFQAFWQHLWEKEVGTAECRLVPASEIGLRWVDETGSQHDFSVAGRPDYVFIRKISSPV